MSGSDSRGASGDAKSDIKERIRHEMREYAIVAGYLFVCFSAVALYKSAVLESFGVRLLPLGIAATKALILGKFLLIIGAVGARTNLPSRSWMQSVPMKTLACFVSLLVLLALEEALVGWFKGHTISQTLAEHKDRSLHEMLAECLLLLLMLFPLIAAHELRRTLGEESVRNLLRGERPRKPD
jgi:hypothetical protein